MGRGCRGEVSCGGCASADAVVEGEEEAGGEGPEAVLDGGYDYGKLEAALRADGGGDLSGGESDSPSGGDASSADDSDHGSPRGDLCLRTASPPSHTHTQQSHSDRKLGVSLSNRLD